MRIKELFTVPKGEKITEKMFAKVLISSVCSMLLCMACLAGTTWAWFTVSVENEGNVIQIGTADVTVTVGGETFVSGSTLPSRDCEIHIENRNLPDEFEKKATLYVTFMLGDTPHGYIILGGDASEPVTVTIKTDSVCSFSWTVSWFAPGNQDVKPLADNLIEILEEDPTEETTKETTISATDVTTSPTTEQTVDSTEATESSFETKGSEVPTSTE